MKKVFLVSLGCDKNLVESEKMLGLLSEDGFDIVSAPEESDVIIINTCSFILDAKQESIETILEMAEYKKTGQCKKLIVTGCLSQRFHDEILSEISEVDAVVGTTAFDEIVNVINSDQNIFMKDINYLPSKSIKRVRTSTPHISYLKIAEGCNKMCTYCIIPYLRGNYRSVPMEQLIQEAKELAQSGTKELILIAQETTVYGIDIYKEKALPKLLKELCKIDGIEWIRIMYCYPEEITEELLNVMKEESKICNYLDLPIQHCNTDVLAKMGRRATKESLVEKINMIRRILPDVALRTTLISGFPGETKQAHDECVEFVHNTRFDRLGVFPYSAEEGTKAATFDNQIDDEIKQKWADEIMETEQDVIFSNNEMMVSKTVEVIVDGYLPDENVYVGRTYADAPEIDGCVFFIADRELISGSIVSVDIRKASGYDLVGVINSVIKE